MTTISAKVVVDSVSPDGHRLTTLLLCYPRWIHAEARAHRQLRLGEDLDVDLRTPSLMEDPNLSRNASSSRAIPVKKMIKDVEADPAVPLFWGRNRPGMQGGEEQDARVSVDGWGGGDDRTKEDAWMLACENALKAATAFDRAGYHKQIVNRLLEPFSHIRVVVSATQWPNFFALRCHADAEPHIALLANRIVEAMDASTPMKLHPGQWHLPFVEAADWDAVRLAAPRGRTPIIVARSTPDIGREQLSLAKKLSVARCASTSYKTVDGFDMTIDRACDLFDKLATAKPMHASPFEHQATPDERLYGSMGRSQWRHAREHANFVGWRQHRKMLPGECAVERDFPENARKNPARLTSEGRAHRQLRLGVDLEVEAHTPSLM